MPSPPPPQLPIATLVLRVLAPFASGYFLSYLYRSVNAVLGPDLRQSAGLDAADIGLLTSAYFLTFAAFQLPLGVLLDRYGPRRVEATLLLFAAVGALAFAIAEGLGTMIAGRALIGFGVSACLMGAFKANTLFFPPARLPLVNGAVLAAGGLGALSATAPVEAALHVTDWRGVFVALAVATTAVAALIFFAVPERRANPAGERLSAQIRGIGQVFRSATFWRVAPVTMLSQSAFMAIQGLWAGPWLRDVVGLERGDAAAMLLAAAGAMAAGFLTIGAVAERLSRLGIAPMAVAGGGMFLFMLTQTAIIVASHAATLPLWLAFGFFGTAGTVTYAVLSQSFPPNLSGRVNTGLNFLAFVGAFTTQAGMGWIVNLWPAAGETYPPEAYRTAFVAVLVLQAAAFLWFAWPRQRMKKSRTSTMA